MKESYQARAVLADLDAGPLDSLKGSPIGPLFSFDRYAAGSGGTGSNWGKGFNNEGAQLAEVVMDAVRKEV
jgi:tubulin beta